MNSIARGLASTAVMVGLMGIVSGRAQAGFLVVSGDTNIVDMVNGSNQFPLIAGNSTFFHNLLGDGKTVKILNTTLSNAAGQTATLNTFYGGTTGVDSSIVSGPITSSLLANTNLFIDVAPDAALTSPEVAAVKSFLLGGGTFFLLGEAASVGTASYPASTAAVASDLVLLGSSMRLTGVSNDALNHTATAANGQILADPFTSGVSSFGYAFTNGISGGISLFLDANKATSFVSHENISTTTVPEPASLALCGIAVVAVAGLARGRRKRFS